jgi:hypothetical protein
LLGRHDAAEATALFGILQLELQAWVETGHL